MDNTFKTNPWLTAFGVIVVIAGVGGTAYFYWPKTVAVTPTPQVQGTSQVSTDGWNIYSDQAHGFSIQYPPDFLLDTKFQYTMRGPGREISGVSFTIPTSMTQGTNLSPDTKVTVEWTGGTNCTAASFLDGGQSVAAPTNTVYDFDTATLLGAAAGNRYEEQVFVLSSCLAIRYFIHYGAIENYDSSSVRAFDRVKLINIFDTIRSTFIEDRKG